MKSINIGDRVKVIRSGEFGTVKEMYDNMGVTVCVLKMESGRLDKYYVNRLTPVEEPKKKDTITISRDDFRKAVADAMDPSVWDKDGKMENADALSLIMIPLTGAVFSTNVEKILFGDLEENV